MGVATERDTATQRAAAVTLTAAGHADGHPHGENRHGGGGGRHGESRGASDGRNGESRKESLIVKSKMDPKVDSPKVDKMDSKTDKTTSDGFAVPSRPSARKVGGTVRGYVLRCEVSCL